VLVSDGRCVGAANFHGFSLSLTAANDVESERLFTALADGGKIMMPLGKTFFSPSFGIVVDRFGVCWMVYVAM
jgi:PhnB protein